MSDQHAHARRLDPQVRPHSPIRLAAPVEPVEPPMVLHVRVVAGRGGGPDKTILRSAHFADRSRVRMAAAYIHPKGDPGIESLRDTARQWGCPFYSIAERTAVSPATVAALYQLCERLQVTVWHGHDYKSNAIGLLLRRFRPMNLVTTVHGWTDETWRTRLYRRVDHWALRRYDQVVAVSPLLHEQCRTLGVPEDRLTHIANAIAPQEYERSMPFDARRAALQIAPDRFVIGVVGRLSVEKGVDRAIRAFSELRNSYPQAELHIVGDGPQRGCLAHLANELNVADAVRFHGWQTDARPFYEAMDMLLLPSHTEGLPNVVLEAMAMGVPVAATNVGGVSDLLDHDRCGVVLSQDESTWPGHIAPLVASRDRRELLAARARDRVDRHYNFSTRMQRMMLVYDRVLSIPESIERQTRRRAA